MNMFRKLIACVCAVSLLLMTLPLSALASSEEPTAVSPAASQIAPTQIADVTIDTDGAWKYYVLTLTDGTLADISLQFSVSNSTTLYLNGLSLVPGDVPLANESYQNSAALKNVTVDTGTTRFNTAIEYDTDAARRSYSRVKHYNNNGDVYSYEYDAAGNISKITNPDGSWVTYTYNELNMLTREDHSDGYQKMYQYDPRGNIFAIGDSNNEIRMFGYSDAVWKDRLTSFDGTTIAYDAIGNPLNWYTGATFSWQHGRQLAGYTLGDTTISYVYNADGIRTSKTVNGVTTYYTVTDGTLRRMTVGDNTLAFVYGNGLSSVIFNGTEYWYVFNAQGDVVGLIDATGAYVVRYTYDAWGKPLTKTGSLADTLGTLNPFRYRGYIYDEETEFYYCQSRYYDPNIGRFINADDIAVAVATPETPHWDKNLFAYCDNNPIIRIDNGGYAWETWFDIITLGNSAAEVVNDPKDIGAWVNLAADAFDLIPFVTGCGEATRALRAANAAVEILDTAHDANRIIETANTVATISSFAGEGMRLANGVVGVGYKSYGALKKALGSAGPGKHWHHIVEQCQITKSGFSMETIQNTGNVIAIDASTHYLITAYYRRQHDFTNGLSFRDWLAGQSFEFQYQEGLRVLRKFGVI